MILLLIASFLEKINWEIVVTTILHNSYLKSCWTDFVKLFKGKRGSLKMKKKIGPFARIVDLIYHQVIGRKPFVIVLLLTQPHNSKSSDQASYSSFRRLIAKKDTNQPPWHDRSNLAFAFLPISFELGRTN